MEIHIAEIYRGASSARTIKLPAIPPRPLQAVTAAAETTRFHCLYMPQRFFLRVRSKSCSLNI